MIPLGIGAIPPSILGIQGVKSIEGCADSDPDDSGL